MNILVTGGAGYIGSHVVRRLIHHDYNPIVIDNFSNGHREFLPKNMAFFEGSIGNKDLLKYVFESYVIHGVMHFGAFTDVGESIIDPSKYYNNNVVETIALLDQMREHEVDKFIFSSSCATYGIPRAYLIGEDHIQEPISPYGRTKLIIEEILKYYDDAYGTKGMVLRYFNAGGAGGEIGEWHDPETHLIPRILRGDSIAIYGNDYNTRDGSCERDYVHVNDLADGHIKALELLLEGGSSDCFNLGRGVGVTVKEVIKICEKVSKCVKIVKEVGRREGDSPRLVANTEKAKEVLGWRAKYNMEDIIESAWEWEKKRDSYRWGLA